MINLHQKCEEQIITRLEQALGKATVKNMMFLERSSLSELLIAEKSLPNSGVIRNSLEKFISETPLFDFVYGSICKELCERDQYDSSQEQLLLQDIDGFKDLGQRAASLVAELKSLPWRYCFTFPLTSEIAKYIEKTEIVISESARIVKKTDDFEGRFPLYSGIEGRDKDLHGASLLVPVTNAQWSDQQAYVQIESTGYCGKWVTTEIESEAIDTLKSLLGLLIALRCIEIKRTYSRSIEGLRYYIHREAGAWEIDDSYELDHALSKSIKDIRKNDLNGFLDTDAKKSNHVEKSIERISKALSQNPESEKVQLAGRWLFDSYSGENELLSFVQTTVALEILLGEKGSSDLMGLGELLRNRCAYLIGDSHNQRKEILNDFNEIYSIRSKIVHRGKNKLRRYERGLFYKLQWMTNRVIQEEINLLGKDA
jgi:hypothetical protein